MARYRIDKQLMHAVLAVPGVSDLIGGRVYPDQGPANAKWPYAVVNCGSSAADKSLNGGEMSARTANYSVVVESTSKKEAGQVAALIAARRQDGGLGGFRGRIGPEGDQVFCQAIIVEDVRDEAVSPASEEDCLRYTTTIDLKIRFNT